MKFSLSQYDKAIENLQLARQQLIDGTQGNGCAVCGGCCHPDQCGHNPLYAMEICKQISAQSYDLHQWLHVLSGYVTHMGETKGPARVCVPDGSDEQPALPITKDWRG